MKSRNKKLLAIGLAVIGLGLVAYFVLNAFKSNLTFFVSPSDVVAGKAPHDRAFRIGGLVESGSVKRSADGMTVTFIVTDTVKSVPVSYSVKQYGPLPDLFKAGKGAVAEGKLDANGVFEATQVLAKHDENYMPPEAASAIAEAKKAEQAAKKP